MSREESAENKDILSSEMNRREFIKASALGVLGTQALFGNLDSQKTPRRVKKGDMHYRRLGRTGLMVSEISLGGSPVPPEAVFRKAEVGHKMDITDIYLYILKEFFKF